MSFSLSSANACIYLFENEGHKALKKELIESKIIDTNGNYDIAYKLNSEFFTKEFFIDDEHFTSWISEKVYGLDYARNINMWVRSMPSVPRFKYLFKQIDSYEFSVDMYSSLIRFFTLKFQDKEPFIHPLKRRLYFSAYYGKMQKEAQSELNQKFVEASNYYSDMLSKRFNVDKNYQPGQYKTISDFGTLTPAFQKKFESQEISLKNEFKNELVKLKEVLLQENLDKEIIEQLIVNIKILLDLNNPFENTEVVDYFFFKLSSKKLSAKNVQKSLRKVRDILNKNINFQQAKFDFTLMFDSLKFLSSLHGFKI